MEKLGLERNGIFIQNNKHSSKIVKEWLLLNVKTQLEHAPQAPDLNVRENSWDHLKRAVKKTNAMSIPTLKQALIEE